MHVVVVGGGFAGVKAALELSKRQIGKITLISDHNYFLHHATLYATATGRSTEESVIPLRLIFANHPNVTIVEDRITAFDPHRKLVSSKTQDYHYDKLVLALGSATSFFNIEGLKKHAYSIKTFDEVQEFHDRIYEDVVQNKLDKEYFVIGGGLSGVELASALSSYLRSLKELYRLKHAQPKVTLVEAEKRILPRLSKTAAEKAKKQLKKHGVRVLVDHQVTALAGNSITIEDKLYPTTTAVWTSGLVNNPFFNKNSGYFDFTKDGRVNVNPYLEALDDVYVVGDNNSVTYSGTAIAALKQGAHVAKNIARTATRRSQIKFTPTSSPISFPVGERWGYVEWGGLYIAGRSGGIVRRWIELHGYKQILPLHIALPIWRSRDISDVDAIL
ncbi:MAG: NAD(P)/FAD-dependent oxidoreductase [Candidatus Microsaccharimonas sp.]